MNAGPPLSASARRVQEAIRAAGFPYRVFELDVPVRTAADAARAVGCEVGQIAKSLVFRAASGRPVLVIASGANRVDEDLLAHPRIWAAAGHPNSLFELDPRYLAALSGGRVAKVAA